MQMNCQYYPELESCHKRTSCLPIQTAFDRPDESIGAEFLARQKRRSRKHLFYCLLTPAVSLKSTVCSKTDDPLDAISG